MFRIVFQRIRHQFTFIYRAEGQAIYDQYEEAKRAVDRKIKARERELMKQIQKEYDAIAPVQDMRAQLEGDVELLSPILCTSGRVRYAFVERSRIAKAFFDPLSTRGAECDVDWSLGSTSMRSQPDLPLILRRLLGVETATKPVLHDSLGWSPQGYTLRQCINSKDVYILRYADGTSFARVRSYHSLVFDH